MKLSFSNVKFSSVVFILEEKRLHATRSQAVNEVTLLSFFFLSLCSSADAIIFNLGKKTSVFGDNIVKFI